MVSSVSMDKLFFPVHSYIEHRDHTIRHYSKSKQRDRAARHWNDYRAAISSSVQAIVRVPQITVFNFCFRILVSRHSRRKPSSHRSIIAFHNTHRRDRCDIIIHLAVIHRARCCVRHTHTHTHTHTYPRVHCRLKLFQFTRDIKMNHRQRRQRDTIVYNRLPAEFGRRRDTRPGLCINYAFQSTP